ncbi:MAG: hypothetical protein JWO36_1597 [Myxococcales bacterium]|nr:hypothetical protein [Myxococcales bacterium]
MATRHAPPPDLVTLASLHAALDAIVEVEQLILQMNLRGVAMASATRLVTIVAEIRTLLIEILRPERLH